MKEETKQSVGEKIEDTVKAAEETVRQPFIKKLARLGFYTKGFLFIVIGALAVMVVVGQRGGELTDPSGALSRIAQASYGRVLLVIFIAGALGHAIWNILRGVADIDDAGKKWQGIFKRSIAVGIGVFYIILATIAWGLLITERVSETKGEIPRTVATVLLMMPLGSVLAFLIGLGMIIAAVNECYTGLTAKYQDKIKLFALGPLQRWLITLLGVLSFSARALLMGLMGYFFISAAINYNPNEATGLDGALAALASTSYGKFLLFFTATGLICHGFLSLYEARLRRIC